MKKLKDKAQRVQIVLSEPQKEFLDATARAEGLSLSALVRQIVDEYKARQLDVELRNAANSLYAEYESDEELTTFNALDSEDFA